jgi:hypothetical protein
MELQKEQLKVEKAKAEASRAKLNLALEQYKDVVDNEADGDDDDYEVDEPRRRKRFASINKLFPGPEESSFLSTLGTNKSFNYSEIIQGHKYYGTVGRNFFIFKTNGF